MLSRALLTRRCYASFQLAILSRLFSSEPTSQGPSHIKCQHNQDIVDLLVKSQKEERSKPDVNPFKIHSFSKAITLIRNFDRPIRSGEDVRHIKGIGSGIVSRINEYFFKVYTEDTEKDIEALREVIKGRAITSFDEFPGIGSKRALELTNAGCQSLDDLFSGQFNHMLSIRQVLSIKYFHHLQQPVSRQEAEDALAFCQLNLDPAFQFQLVGDYRRGIEPLENIEIMISHPNFVYVPLPLDLPPNMAIPDEPTLPKPRKRRRRNDESPPMNILHSDIIPHFRKAGFISDTLVSDLNSWKGYVRLPGQDSLSERLNAIKNVEGRFRRVTFNIVPQRSLAASLLCFTGNQKFAKYLCVRAQQRGMLLNEFGLWRWTAHQFPSSELEEGQADSSGYWALVKCSSEEDIFRELELDFINPTERTYSPTFKIPKLGPEIDLDVDV